MEVWSKIFSESLQGPMRIGHQVLKLKTEEVRLRVGQPLIMKGAGRLIVWQGQNWHEQADCPNHNCNDLLLRPEDIQHVFNRVSQGSLYAIEEELKNGYITIPGGHRLGFCGRAIVNEGILHSIKDVRFINLRIARQIKGCLTDLLPYLTQGGRWLSVLIISPPLGGKTTLLRELVRLASSGIPGKWPGGQLINGVNVSLVDERSELAGSYLGIPQFDLGPSTDILDGCPKAQGMMLMIRSMSPQILAVDEIGRSQDIEALYQALACGITIFATIHGLDHNELQNRPGLEAIINQGLFQRIIVLKGYGSQRNKPDIFDGRTLNKLY